MKILERHDTNAVCHLHLNAPERLNALSDEMLAALQDQLDALQNDSSIRVVVLSGAGKAFCAGHDLKEMTRGRSDADGGAAYFANLFARCATWRWYCVSGCGFKGLLFCCFAGFNM